MSMSKTQNDELSLQLLFLQRVSYKRAKQFKNSYIFLQLLIILISVLKYYNVLNNQGYWISFGVLFIFSISLGYLSSKYNLIGVKTQDYFDRRLFGLLDYIDSNIDLEDLTHRAQVVKKRYSKDYAFQVSNTGDKGGVKDWYTLPNKDERLLPLYCQLENNIWSFHLARINLAIYSIFFTLMSLSLLCIFWNQPLSALVIFICRYLTIIFPFTLSVFKLTSMVRIRLSLKNKIDNMKLRKNISLEKLNVILNDIQVQAFQLRREKYLISDLIYNIFRENRHSFVSKYISNKFEEDEK